MHPLKPDEVRFAEPVKRPWACVSVNYRGKDLVVVPESIAVVRSDTIFAPLPDRIKVVDENGKPLKASKRFFISVETMNPFHVLIDKENLDNEAY